MDEELKRLVAQFDAGDRDPALLKRLNQEAFRCFHAPWEEEGPEVRTPLPVDFFGGLPGAGEEKSTPGSEADQELRIPDLRRCERALPEACRPLRPSESAEPGPMLALTPLLMAAASAMTPVPRFHLMMELPYDRAAEGKAIATFRPDSDTGGLIVEFRTDAALGGLSEAALQGLCTGFDAQGTSLQAAVYRPQPGARARIQILGWIPEPLTQSPLALASHLEGLLRCCRAFWRQVQRQRPQ